MSNNKNLKPHLAVLGANIIYGVNYTIAKDVMPDFVTPFGLVFCRVSGALLLFWLIYSFTYEKVARKDLLLLGACGFFGVFANQMMFLHGLDITTPINAGIIMVSNPIMVLIVSAIILKNRITLPKVGGITLGVSGALLILLFKNDFSFGSETLVGDVFIFVFPFSISEFLQIEWGTFTPTIWFKFSFVVIATTFFAYLFNIYGLKRLNPTTVSTYIYLQPLLAASFAIWSGKDTLDWIKVAAALLIFGGVYLVGKTSMSKF